MHLDEEIKDYIEKMTAVLKLSNRKMD